MTAFFSNRVKAVQPSATLAMGQKARDLKLQGHDVISLAGGEPDFPTPQDAILGARKAMVSGQTKYTAVDGSLKLKKAIIEKFKRDNNLSFAQTEIIASTGGKQVLFNALMATVNPGDEVIIPAPYWVSYPEMVRIAEGTPVIVEGDSDGFFKITPQQLEEAITPKTKWLILNSPSNPTGAVYSKAELEDLAEVLRRHDHVWCLSDDIYEHLVFDGREFHTLLEVAPDLRTRVLTMNGVSKAYSMTGWRLGYAGGPEALIKAMKTIQSQSTSCPSSITQAATVEMLNGDQEFLNSWRDDYQQRRDDFVAGLRAIDGLSVQAPEGAFYVYTSCAGLIGKKTPEGKVLETDLDVSEYFLEQAKVATVAGTAFGLTPYLRMSFAIAADDLKRAVKRLEEAVAELT